MTLTIARRLYRRCLGRSSDPVSRCSLSFLVLEEELACVGVPDPLVAEVRIAVEQKRTY